MEELLLLKIRSGDEKAFQVVFNRYYAVLCRYACQLLGNAQRAEEVVDDTIFYLWEKRETLEIHSLQSYLMRAVRNRCINAMQSPSWRCETTASVYFGDDNINFLETVFDESQSPLKQLLLSELEQEIKRSIDSLPEACRKVLEKSRFDGKSYEEIASELKISVNTVKYHMKNALARLYRELSPYLSNKEFILLFTSAFESLR